MNSIKNDNHQFVKENQRTNNQNYASVHNLSDNY